MESFFASKLPWMQHLFERVRALRLVHKKIFLASARKEKGAVGMYSMLSHPKRSRGTSRRGNPNLGTSRHLRKDILTFVRKSKVVLFAKPNRTLNQNPFDREGNDYSCRHNKTISFHIEKRTRNDFEYSKSLHSK